MIVRQGTVTLGEDGSETCHSIRGKNNMDKNLAQEIETQYQNLLKAIAKVPGTTIEEVRNIIAYNIGWGKLLIYWYTSGITGVNPIMPGEGFTKWEYDKIAQHFYQKYKYDNLDLQLKEFASVVQQILDIVNKESKTGNLNKFGVWQWCTLKSGKQWPLAKWIQVNTVAPYKGAIAKIKKLKGTR